MWVEVRASAGGEPRWEEAIAAAARWAVDSGAVSAVEFGDTTAGAADRGGGQRWMLEISPHIYPAPTMLAELVKVLLEEDGGCAEPRFILSGDDSGRCRLVRSVSGPVVRAKSAIAFRDVRFDVDGRPTTAPAETPWQSRTSEPFLTVVVRTQGCRPTNLEEALTCLAAQTVNDFEVQLAVHDASPAVLSSVVEQAKRFPTSFVSRLNVFLVVGGGRARPLNEAMARASGSHVAFLDDDDLVTADWVEAFASAAEIAPTMVLRAVALNQQVRRTSDTGYELEGPLERIYPAAFDLVEHIHENATPIFSYAAPVTYLRETGTRFCEDLPVLEDWDFLLRVAIGCGVHDIGRATGIYHRWINGESALQMVPVDTWQEARQRVLERLDRNAIALPPGSANRLASLIGDLRRARDETASVHGTLHRTERDLDTIRRSRSWRITAPLRWLSGRVRR